MFYFVRPGWLKKLYPDCIWSIKTAEPVLYLSFDDGPHPSITPFVLAELKKYNALASFFCIGKNVAKYPDVYQQVLEAGHTVGNHSFNHLNGWKTKDTDYLEDIQEARTCIRSHLFRPPYGKIRFSQARKLALEPFTLKTVMWSVLSGDFDISLTPSRCLDNVLTAAGPGSIIVFHDSEKAYERLHYALPAVLKYFSEKGFRFGRLGDVL